MRAFTLILGTVVTLCLTINSDPAAADDRSISHASEDFIQLAADFRAFRSPLFRARTWRPTHQVEGVPDYAEVVRSQRAGLQEFRERLNAIDPGDWPVHDQVDYLLLRSEMDDVYFEQHILREVETNAGYYVEQAVNGVAREIPDVIPYSRESAEAIIAALDRTARYSTRRPTILSRRSIRRTGRDGYSQRHRYPREIRSGRRTV